ncbi:DMT family transporter [Aetokthonos hydrillicola]|uniref:DMT family transporter n=1 Tax=Aetokthonos hydrillicola TaxID=1550245 RepID=UPI001ABAB3F0
MTNILSNRQHKIESAASIQIFILLLIAVLLVSLDPIFTRLTENDLGPNATVFNRELIASVVFLFWQGIKVFLDRNKKDLSELKKPEPITLGTVATLLAVVIFGEVCLVTWALSLTQTTVANSNLLHNLPSVFTVLAGWLFLGQRFDKKFLIGMTVALTGAIAIGIQDLQVSQEHLIGDAWALFSAAVYAGYFLTIKKLRSQFSTLTLSLWCCIVSSAVLLPFVLIFENQVFPASLWGWVYVISLSVLCQVIASVWLK